MRILIVEDSKYKREYVKGILKQRTIEFHVEEAITPALRYIDSNKCTIDGIILDIQLPRFKGDYVIVPLGGLEIVDEISSLQFEGFNKEIPILINSTDAFNIKYDDYLFDTHNIKGKACPYTSDYANNINSFISSIEKGEF